MRYTVTWKPRARNQLANIWMGATNRQAVTDAANATDQALQVNPDTSGEARSGRTRVLIESPLILFFDVHHDDCRVDVLAVRYIPPQVQS
jgi:plasmid stabilization system protein ParE